MQPWAFLCGLSQHRAQLDFLAANIWRRVISPSAVSAAPTPNMACITGLYTAHCGSPSNVHTRIKHGYGHLTFNVVYHYINSINLLAPEFGI
jgi:hypothetical protein